MLHKRKKSSRYRASKTHGCGSMKKRRGKGNKGGAGNAGSFKRGDQKRPSFWQQTQGKQGFKPKGIKLKIKAIGLQDVQKLITKGSLKEEKGIYNLGKLGYNKLLSKGEISKPIKIKVLKASKKVIERVKKVGGEVIIATKEKQTE